GKSTDTSSYSTFKLGNEAKLLNGKYSVGMSRSWEDPSPYDGYGIVVDIYGTIKSDYEGITINGLLKPTNINSQNLPKITIHNGAVIDTPKGVAVYGAGYGEWIFEDGCKVTGDEVLSIKSGNWTINGGTFTCNGKYYDPAIKWDSGTEPTGAAVSITDNPGYARNVSLIINGGTFTSDKQSALFEGQDNHTNSKSALSEKGITINGGTFITHNDTLYPIYIRNLNAQPVHVTLNGQTPFYPNLNLSAARWEKDADNKWTAVIKENDNTLTFVENIADLKCLDLSEISKENKVTIQGTDHIVKAVDNDKYSFDGWSNGAEKLPAITKELYGGKVYTPQFKYIKQYETGEEVEDDEPTPTAEPTPIVTPTHNQTVTPTTTVKPTVKPTPEPKTVVIVESEVKFEDNKVITSITVPEGSSGSITFTQTEEETMDEWIPESIEDSYSFDLSCDGEINGDSEIHFVMSDTILKSLGLTPEDVCLKHFEDGVWVKLKISYIILDDGTYYYTAVTKSFSPFEISFDAKSEEPTATPTEEQPTKSPMPIVGLLMGLGAALVLRRK
ncbi:MAG TPA: PGF-pre-PGF domain-containing protein, partial [Methanocorpusculum sp.]|nr:PGF-pre-PGF domain-containing protein [Methanocorpusculum sp.]